MTPDAIMNWPGWARAKHFRRQEVSVTIAATTVQLLGPNPNRIGCIISVPLLGTFVDYSHNVRFNSADTSTAGVKLTNSEVSNYGETLALASFQETTGTGVVADLEWVTGGIANKLARYTTSGLLSTNMPIGIGDSVRWNVITPIAASVSDFVISFITQIAPSRVTLSVNSPVVDGSGIVLYAQSPPLVLWRDVIGDALTEGLYAISSTPFLKVNAWDLFY